MTTLVYCDVRCLCVCVCICVWVNVVVVFLLLDDNKFSIRINDCDKQVKLLKRETFTECIIII